MAVESLLQNHVQACQQSSFPLNVSAIHTDRSQAFQGSVDSYQPSVHNMPVSSLEREKILLSRASDQIKRCQIALFRNRQGPSKDSTIASSRVKQ